MIHRLHSKLRSLASIVLVAILGLTTLGSANAQTVTIGAGTSNGPYFPIYSCYGYNYSQQIYLASELIAAGAGGGAGYINKIRFKVQSPTLSNSTYLTWTVYLGNTGLNQFATTTSWAPVASLQQCFTGDIPTLVADQWMELTLTTPFLWDGSSNLIVAIDENVPSYSCSTYWYNYTATSSGGYRGLLYYSDGTNPDPASPPSANIYQNDLAQIQLDYVPATPCAGTPIAGAASGPASVCPNSPFLLSLNGATIASGMTFQWYSSPQGAGTFTPIPGANSSMYTATQSVAMDYYCEVTCNNSSQTTTSTQTSVDINDWMLCYCTPPSNTYGTSYYISSFSTQNAFQNISNLNSGISPGSYGDFFSTMEAIGIQGAPVNFTLVTDQDADAAIYVDWNQDGSFDVSEMVYSADVDYQNGTTQNGSFVVPTTALTGSTRMRVRINAYYYNVPDPCVIEEYGETEDYKFTVYPMPTCDTIAFPTSVDVIASPTALCISGDIHFNLSQNMPIASGITYQWQSSPTQAGVYTNLGAAQASVPFTYNTATSAWYRCDILCNGASVLTSTPIYVEAVVPANPVLTDGQHCGPGSVTLTGTVSAGNIYWYQNATGGTPIATGNSFTTPPLATTTTYYASAGASPPVDTFVGTGTIGAATAVSPFYAAWGGYKHQYIILASELTAIGIEAGELPQIGVYVTNTSVTQTFQDFSISMGQTSASSLAGGYEAVAEVLPPQTFLPVPGVNMFTLATPFVWDGVSNIVIQTCHSNMNYGGTSIAVRYNTVTFAGTRYNYADNTPVATICGSTTGTTMAQRPHFYFTTNGCQTPRLPVIANIRDTPVVNLGLDESLCGDNGQTLTLNAGNPGCTYLWDDGSTGQTRTINQSGTYSVTATTQYGCSHADTVTKMLLPSPEYDLGNDTTICNGLSLTITASDGNSYYWNTGATVPSIEVSTTGMYAVIVTNSLGCTTTDTINVTVAGEIPSIGSIIVTNVGPYTFNFEVFNLEGAVEQYTWDFGDGSPVSHMLSPTHTYADAGNYIVTLTLNTSYCGDFDNTTSVHIVGLDEIIVDQDVLSVYPNPAHDKLNIQNKGTFKMEELTITNVLGQVIAKEAINGKASHQINLSGFASGIYSLKIKTDKGYILRKFEVLK